MADPQTTMSTDIDIDDDAEKQLHRELSQSITQALSTRRPLLTHLNADTTWLLSLPHPSPSPPPGTRAKKYFHILIDPWLRGSQSDVAAFFSQQWHAVASSVQTIAEVEDVICGIEEAAYGEQGHGETRGGRRGEIDAVVISHEFTDHMHKETLLEVSRSVPVYATHKAAGLIRSWGHFGGVYTIPKFAGEWRGHGSLPEWVGITRVGYEGADLLYYHSAIMIAFSTAGGEAERAEAVVYTPHGVQLRDLQVLGRNPQIKTLALMHGLQDISLPAGAQLNLGAHNGLKVLRMLGAKYWVGTHDEVKKGGGIVCWFLNRKVIGLKEAIEREKADRGDDLDGTGLEDMADVQFEELGNGESIILE